jgi:hypothetical protein
MESSGVLRRVAFVRTDVSKDLSASIIRVTRIGELGTLVVDCKICFIYSSFNDCQLKKKAIPEIGRGGSYG